MSWKSGFKLTLFIACILAWDFVSKGIVNFYIQPIEHVSNFFPFGGVAVFRDFLGIDFCIHHVTNRGAAWGIGGNIPNLLLWVRIAVLVGLMIYLKISSNKVREYRYPIALIIAGGLGNILDHFIYGHVVDMFHFTFWGYSYPVFNIADISIFLGIAWLLIHSFNRKKHAIAQTQ
jgi:signal peptidase II